MNRVSKFATLAFGAMCALGVAAPSQAAVFNNYNPVNGTGGFGNTDTANGRFRDTFSFTVTRPGTLATYVQNLAARGSGDIDFLSATLSGPSFASPVNYSFTRSAFLGNPDGNEQGNFGFTNLLAGVYTLVVTGNAGAIASYTGDFTVTGAGAVPEPATWALMIGGMGAAGIALRRRRSIAARAALA